MKQAQGDTGGRPFNNDDFLTIQQELTDAVQAQFLGKGPFIVAGCLVSGPATGANVTAGVVFLDGQLLRYDGGSSIVLPAQFQAGAVVQSDPRPYQTGGTKFCMREVPAVLVASDPTYTGGQFLPLDTWGGKTWTHVQRASVRYPTEVMAMASITTSDFDAAGVAKPGTMLWGWAFADGQNSRADLRENFVAGFNPANPAYAVGATGGAATVTLDVSQIPAHSHDLQLPYGQSNNGQGRPVRTDGSNQGNQTYQTNGTGGGQPHNNLPPYYALAMLQWVGY